MNPDGHAMGPLEDVAAPDAEEAIFAGKSENKTKNALVLSFEIIEKNLIVFGKIAKRWC